MLNIELDQETETRLVEILAREKTTSDELIKPTFRRLTHDFRYA
jgi:hypothetical protein